MLIKTKRGKSIVQATFELFLLFTFKTFGTYNMTSYILANTTAIKQMGWPDQYICSHFYPQFGNYFPIKLWVDTIAYL